MLRLTGCEAVPSENRSAEDAWILLTSSKTPRRWTRRESCPAAGGVRGGNPRPAGSISLATAPEYLKPPNVSCVGGSWLTPRSAVERGDWAQITALAREASGVSVR